METTRHSLLQRVRRSPQDDSWKEFVGIYSPFIRGYLCRMGLPDEDVDDIQQEVLHILVKELPRFDHNGRPGAFRAWLRNVVGYRLRTFRRSPARRQLGLGGSDYDQLADQLADENSDLSRAWEREHNQFLVQSLMEMVAGRFDAKTLQAFRRTFLDERSIRETADELEMSVNAVVIARTRVLKVLRDLGEGMID